MKEDRMSNDCHKIICIFEQNSQKSVVFTQHGIPVRGSQVHNTQKDGFDFCQWIQLRFPQRTVWSYQEALIAPHKPPVLLALVQSL